MRSRLASLLVAVAFAPCAQAIPPAEFDAWRSAFEEAYDALFTGAAATSESLFTVRSEHVARLNFADLTPTQIAFLNHRRLIKLRGPEGQVIDRTPQALARLAQFTTDSSVEGAAALLSIAAIHDAPDQSSDDQIAAVRPVLRHPAIVDAAVSASSLNPLTVINVWKDDARAALAPDMLAFAVRFASSASIEPDAAMALESMYSCVGEAAADQHADRLEAIRTNFIRLAADVRDNRAADLDKRQLAYLDSQITTLELAPKVAKLVGSDAPNLTVLWSSGPEISSLHDLRGNVVVLDFWATWCGPCVATFPELRELTARYDGYAVVVLGVTSPQGSVVSPTEGAIAAETPEEEFALMARYINANDVTWPIIFTQQDVFNPEYGVRGIPHTAIIDPDGVLRHRAIHPSQGVAHLASLIDPILSAHNLPAPPPIEQ